MLKATGCEGMNSVQLAEGRIRSTVCVKLGVWLWTGISRLCVMGLYCIRLGQDCIRLAGGRIRARAYVKLGVRLWTGIGWLCVMGRDCIRLAEDKVQ